ncbi:hypothetical protein FRC09_006118 [Ceratobasidium sp. 395]|nr:hypothetical protein FRC09_006118 [Ceratobasidium sp. 395]
MRHQLEGYKGILIAVMSFPPDGPYAIIKSPPPNSPEQYLTQEGNESRAPILILPPSGAPGQHDWLVSRGELGGITLRNIQSGKFVGYNGSPDENKRVVAVDHPTEFTPMPGQGPNSILLGVPESNNLVIDQPLTKDFPPQAVLAQHDPQRDQEWRFEPQE